MIRDKRIKEKIINIMCSTLFLVIVLLLVLKWGYIDFSVIRIVYFPIWIISAIGILIGQHIFSYVFITFAGTGLILEYLVHVTNKGSSSNLGPVVNNSLLVLGLVLGMALQVYLNYRRKWWEFQMMYVFDPKKCPHCGVELLK